MILVEKCRLKRRRERKNKNKTPTMLMQEEELFTRRVCDKDYQG